MESDFDSRSILSFVIIVQVNRGLLVEFWIFLTKIGVGSIEILINFNSTCWNNLEKNQLTTLELLVNNGQASFGA